MNGRLNRAGEAIAKKRPPTSTEGPGQCCSKRLREPRTSKPLQPKLPGFHASSLFRVRKHKATIAVRTDCSRTISGRDHKLVGGSVDQLVGHGLRNTISVFNWNRAVTAGARGRFQHEAAAVSVLPPNRPWSRSPAIETPVGSTLAVCGASASSSFRPRSCHYQTFDPSRASGER